MKTLLFDIDGTLIVTNGTGTQALDAVLRENFGVECPNLEVKFGGRTDCSLLREVMLMNDINPSQLNFDTFASAYHARLPDTLQECGGIVLPGVVELLTRLRQHDDLRCAVMTGNLPVDAPGPGLAVPVMLQVPFADRFLRHSKASYPGRPRLDR